MSNADKVAFITTPNFRRDYRGVIQGFICTKMFPLTQVYRVICSGNTFDLVEDTLRPDFGLLNPIEEDQIRQSMGLNVFGVYEYESWRRQLRGKISGMLPGAPGVVEILYELVEGRLAGVIHLTHPEDLEAKADSAVLWREANVHNVPIAHDITTGGRFIDAWAKGKRSTATGSLSLSQALAGITDQHKVLAMIAHDGKKLDICEFAVANANRILAYDFILATGTTAEKLIGMLRAQNQNAAINKIRPCLSGPNGGDIQIAYAVIKGLCQKVIFFQDPLTAHPHEVDIRLFERIVLDSNRIIEMATNRSAAELIL